MIRNAFYVILLRYVQAKYILKAREICEVKNETERKNRSIIYGGNGNTADSYQCIIFYDNKQRKQIWGLI